MHMKNNTRLGPFLFVVTVFVMMAVSCEENKHSMDFKSGQADSLIFDAGALKDYNRMLTLIDSFEQVGNISVMNADRWRGTASYRQGQYRSAEFYYQKVVNGKIETAQDSLAYAKSARRLSELLLIKGDYEGS
jgi:hypothetical protein